jgi:hypothetical protein
MFLLLFRMTEKKSGERGAVVPLSKELTTDRALAVGNIGEIGVARQLCAEEGGIWGSERL